MACSRLTTLLALPVAVSLMLGAVPWDARADICKKRKLGSKCVDSADVQDQSLGLIDIKDEAGFKYKVARGRGRGSIGSSEKTVVSAVLKAPRKGWAVATASVDIDGLKASSEASVRCEILGSGGSATARRAFYDSVAFESGIVRGSMAATLSFKVKKGSVAAWLRCRRLSGGAIRVLDAGIVIQYYPTRY